MLFAVGTYADPTEPGIYVYRLDAKTFKITLLSRTAGIENPSFLSLSADCRRIFVVSESKTGDTGQLVTFGLRESILTLIDKVSYNGAGSCYVTTDHGCHHAFIANYRSGSLLVLQLRNGSQCAVIQEIKFNGHGPDKARQEQSHAHAVLLSADEKFLYCTDLGADRLYKFRLDPNEKQPLSPYDQPYLDLPAGSGPRHFVFSPNGAIIYLLCELSGEIYIISANGNEMVITGKTRVAADNYLGEIEAADLQLHPRGDFLYTSCRGNLNEIGVFKIMAEDGTLHFIQRISSEGKSPRSLLITPDGKLLLAANEKSGNLALFKITGNGQLTFTEQVVKVDSPSCLKWLAPARS